MKIYKKGNIVSVWDKIIDKNQHYKLGMEVKENIIYKIVRDTYSKMIMDNNEWLKGLFSEKVLRYIFFGMSW